MNPQQRDLTWSGLAAACWLIATNGGGRADMNRGRSKRAAEKLTALRVEGYLTDDGWLTDKGGEAAKAFEAASDDEHYGAAA